MGTSAFDKMWNETPAKRTGFDDLWDNNGVRPSTPEAARMRAIMSQPTAPPDQAAEAVRVGRRANIPATAALESLDALKAMQSAGEFDADTFVRDNPATSRWLTADPINAAVARDDFESLSKTERIFGRYQVTGFGTDLATGKGTFPSITQTQRGTVQAAFGQAPETVMLARIYNTTTRAQRRDDPAVRAQIDALRAQMPKMPDASVMDNPLEASLRFFAEGLVPSMGYIAGKAGTTAVGGAIAGGLAEVAAATLVGSPVAGVTVAGGMTIGAGLGAYNAAKEFSKMSQAMRLEDVRDENGNPLSDRTIDVMSEVYSVFGGALEVGGYGLVGRQVAKSIASVGAANLAERAATKAATNLLTQVTGRRVATEVAKTMAVGVAVETGEEVAAEFTAIGTEALARIAGNVQGGQFGPVENVVESLLTTAYQTALGSIWFGGLAGGAVGIGGMNRLRQAQEDAEVLTELSENAAMSKLRQRDPEKYAEVIAAQTPEGLEKVGMEAERLVMLLQEASIPLAQFAEVAGITEQEVTEAIASGGDVYLPMPQVMSRLVGTPIFEGMKLDLKLRPDGMSQREADAMAKEVEAESAKIQEEMEAIVQNGTEDASGQRVIDELIAQITAATEGQPKSKRFTEANIEQTARGIAAFYITQAQRTGVDAYELYASRGYSILGRQQGEGLYDAVQELRRLRTEGTPEQVKEAEAKVRQQGELLQQAAFHGTPHTFDRFSLSAIGTGEGAQAYGWGIYVAESQDIAEGYAKNLATKDTLIDGEKVWPNDPRFEAAIAIDIHGYKTALAIAERESQEQFLTEDGRASATRRAENIKALKRAKVGRRVNSNLYRVDIPDAAVATYLDWDKPLSEQAPEVREAMASFIDGLAWHPPRGDSNWALKTKDGRTVLWRSAREGGGGDVTAFVNKMSGETIYKTLAGGATPQESSMALLAAGIRGIKYLDAGSRGQGEGSRNLVVFDESDVTITHRNGEPVTAQERTDFLAQEGMQGRALTFKRSKTFKTDEGKFANFDLEDVAPRNRTAMFTVFLGKKGTGYTVRNALIPESMRRQGIAQDFYRQMNAESLAKTGKPLNSTMPRTLMTGEEIQELSDDGRALWESFVRSGEAEKVGVGYRFLAQPKTAEPLGDTIDVDGVSRPTTNSTGQPIHPTAEGVRNFWRWFAGSRVVDEQGRPLVVYHGTNVGVDEFTSLPIFTTPDPAEASAYAVRSAARELSPDEPIDALSAKEQMELVRDAGVGMQVYPVYVRSLNLLDATKLGVAPSTKKAFAFLQSEGVISEDEDWQDYDNAMTGDSMMFWAQIEDADLATDIESAGFDGFRFVDASTRGGRHDAIAVLDPTQVKSALGNSGAFGPSADILMQEDARRGPVTQQELDAIAEQIRTAAGVEKLELRPGAEGDVRLEVIATAQTNTGVGSVAMRQLTDWADGRGVRLTLALAEMSYQPIEGGPRTSSTNRLEKFYRRFGFVPNRGRKQDASLSDDMYREPRPSAAMLNQGTGRPNAFIIPGVGQQTIALMNGANLSSLLHEFAHDWLVILGEQAAKPDAPAQVRADYQSLLKELGVASTAEIGVEQQENFARMWERYYATAEAPSRALARVFTSFKRWMQKVYKDVREMFVPVSPEVARLFDRMIATDAELELARGANGSGAMLTEKDGETLGATPDEMEGYAKAVLWRTAQEEARLIKAVVEDEGKEMTEQYQAEAESVRAEVRAELEAQPVYRAFKFLREPDANGKSVKLNVEQYEAEHGKRPRGLQGIWSTAEKAPFAKKEGADVVGTDAESMALAYGFRDGTAFIDALRAMEDLEVAVERRVREEMRVRFPDLTPFSQPLADEAQRVQHLADTDDVLVRELNLLAKSSGIRAPNVQAVKRAAKAIIAKLKVRDIRPIVYQNAEAKAARLSMEAFKAGDPEKAAFHKRQQLLNHILYREAVKQQERVGVIQRFAKRMMATPTQERMGKAGKVYQDALNSLLQSYDFRNIPLRNLDALEYDRQPRLNKTAALNAYKEAALEDALVVASIPASVSEQEGVVNYQQLSVMELDNVYSVMHQVYETASRKDKALRENEKRNLQEQADAFVESVTSLHALTERPIDYYPLSLANAKQKLAAVDAWHLPPEFLFVWLDGDTTGTAYTLFFKPFAEAEAEEFRRGEIAFKEMQRIEEMIDLPSVVTDTSVAYEGIRSKMTKRSIIALALNMGTESGVRASLEAQVDGKPQFGSYDAIMAMFAQTLTEADWKYITAKWDYANTFWPDIAELERQTNGIIPQKLEAAPFFVRTADGEDISVKGGYYPLSYASAKLGAGGAVKVIAQVAGLEEGVISPSGGARAQTMHGWTEERVKASGRPINLDLNVWNGHIVNVIHDLTHRKAVRDVYRLYKRKDVRQTIEQSAGQEAYNALMPWLARIANPNQSFDNSFAENTIARARAGVTAVNMGLSVSVAMVQPLGYLQAADVIGPMWVAKGIAASFSPNFKSVAGAALGAAAYGSTLGPAGTAIGGLFGAFVGGLDKASADVLERSVAMRQRREDFSRDARDYVKTRKNRLNGFEKFYFSFIGMMDNAVMVPVWIGAYRKAMAENGGNDGEAVQYADSVIRRSQGAGSPKDLSRVQGGPELRRMLTIHYSFMSRQYGLFRRTATNLAEGRMTKARVLASVAMIGVLSPILSELVAGRPPEDDEEWLPWAMIETMRGAAGSIILLRDVARALGPKAFPYKISPVEDALKKTVGSIQTVGEQTVGQLFSDEDTDLTESELKEIVETVGYWTRTPTRAIWRVVTSFTDWMQGYDVESADFIRSRPR